MRGIGGPLLTIGDLLSDVGEESSEAPDHHKKPDASLPPPSILDPVDASSQSLDLIKLFQENFEKLNEALAGSDHSWTALTLELCTALETANKLVQSTDTNVRSLSEKVRELEKIVKRGDSAITAARAISISLNQKGGSSVASENREEYGSPQ
ncbi:hypothetical protein ES319_D05G245200v1 [Gossypium barbadense]|uniref:Uncharacterized protein n=3 Tax=Gossypium TaxID=3633 RepID=A0A0D2TQR3_GOSRA|nr:uncharacterized protein LOC105769632 [Gossypium raimondii]KAB2030614.1 hypothetical protein ES319_D05G245200v1 [Gossypium barbadense]KJB59179.1 hypothetical protein B456_009G244100 [Gossypium raimondii]MBA0595764.1 hypothetical protein [Gossypium raimondii]PPD93559.1 hypothetical protein GOBAR_DD09510 [Gossypium barbadense]